jgi:hypothetical protein
MLFYGDGCYNKCSGPPAPPARPAILPYTARASGLTGGAGLRLHINGAMLECVRVSLRHYGRQRSRDFSRSSTDK